jgi:2'-5' RNA ligase
MHDSGQMQGKPAGNVFYALIPPPDIVAPLREAVERLRPDTAELAWVDSRRWHVTAAFLGRVDPAPFQERQIVLPERPQLTLSGAGTFGDRVLWAGVRGSVAEVLRAVGAHPEAHTAHLTLARVRGRRRWSGLKNVAARLTYPERGWLPDRLVLLRSVPGLPYEELAAWPWTGDERRTEP